MSDRSVSRAGRLRPGHVLADGLLMSVVFVAAAARYWLLVFPRVASELRHWRRSARADSRSRLRRLALAALEKRGNMEGAAAFATFVRSGSRRDVVHALVAFQAIYNHVDLLAEQPSGEDPESRARALHEALVLALEPGAGSPARHGQATQLAGEDGGYLAEMIEACRWALSRLPGFLPAAPAARLAARRIVAFQSLSLGEHGKLEAWAVNEESSGGGLEWWETAAATGSSLTVNALIAAAASPALGGRDVDAIEAAYFPVIGALHSLLDSLVDEVEDAATGQLQLVGCYCSAQEAAVRMRSLTARAIDAARGVPRGRCHALLVAAMACNYLADCERSNAQTEAVASAVRASIGGVSRPLLLVFALRRLARRLAPSRTARAVVDASPQPQPQPPAPLVDPGKRGAGARAT